MTAQHIGHMHHRGLVYIRDKHSWSRWWDCVGWSPFCVKYKALGQLALNRAGLLYYSVSSLYGQYGSHKRPIVWPGFPCWPLPLSSQRTVPERLTYLRNSEFHSGALYGSSMAGLDEVLSNASGMGGQVMTNDVYKPWVAVLRTKWHVF